MSISIPIVFLASLGGFLIGFLLHGPVAGKLWLELAHITPTSEEKMIDMLPRMGMNFFIQFLFALAFSILYSLVRGTPGMEGVLGVTVLALIVWAGFVLTTTYVEVIWMGRSFQLWLFEAVASLITCLVIATIIALF